MISDPRPLTQTLKVLVDPTRLRILGLLEREELSVGELSRALEMAQSRVSNHLRVLREERFLRERHVGSSTYLSLGLQEESRGDLRQRLWSALKDELVRLPEREADLARLDSVVRERSSSSRAFFDRMAGQWDKLGVDFASGQARLRTVCNLLPDSRVYADLGCGTGYFGRSLVGLCTTLILVDSSQAMLDEASTRLAPLCEGTELAPRRGELDALPIADAELDGLVCGMVLHHLADLAGPLAEMRRVLKPGAHAAVLELAPHRESWMHELLGDRHLGLDPRDVCAAFERAGFLDVRLESVEDRYCPPREGGQESAASLPLYIVRGRAPADVS